MRNRKTKQNISSCKHGVNLTYLPNFGKTPVYQTQVYQKEGRYKKKTDNKNATSHTIQAISMTVQRGNGTSIMGTLGQLDL